MSELTGQCKKDFGTWYLEEYFKKIEGHHYIFLDEFWKLKPPFQFGVIQDFFDSVRIDIIIDTYCKLEQGVRTFEYFIYYDAGKRVKYMGSFTRHEARAAAIEKAVEIYNNK